MMLTKQVTVPQSISLDCERSLLSIAFAMNLTVGALVMQRGAAERRSETGRAMCDDAASGTAPVRQNVPVASFPRAASHFTSQCAHVPGQASRSPAFDAR